MPTLTQPTVAELMHIVITETDFCGDLTNTSPVGELAMLSVLRAAEIWLERYPEGVVSVELIAVTFIDAISEGFDMLEGAAQAKHDALLDQIEAGDLDRDGNFIPWPKYRSA